jgi:tape measure domain-containing protein
MAEERIDIVVTQRGAREVKRDLEGIGAGATASIPNLDRLKNALQQLGGAASLSTGPSDVLRDAMSKLGINADLGARGLLRMSTALGSVQTAMEATWGVTIRLGSAVTALALVTSSGAGLPALGRAASLAIGPLNQVGTALAVVSRNGTAVVRQLNLVRGSFEQLRVSGGGAQRMLFDAAASARDITPNMNGVGQATRNAGNGFAAAGRGAGGAIPPINNLGSALGGLGGAANGANLSFFSLWRVLLAYTVIHQVTQAVIQSIDSWIMMSNRLRQVSTDSLNLVETQDAVYAAAQRTRSGMEDIATLYTRTAMATEKLGLSQKEVMDITETVAMAMKLNGGSVQETASAMRQLSQAFNKGKLDGDEFRSIMENAPQLQKLFADSLGVTKGALMQMASDGTLTLDILIKALQEGGDALREDFAGSLPTIAEGFQYVGNSFTQFVGKLNEATGFSQGFYRAMQLIGDNIDIVIAALGVVAIAIAAAFGPTVVSMLVAFGGAVLVALGPIGLVVAGLSAVAAGILVWRGRTRSATDAAIEHRAIIASIVDAYEEGDGAVAGWADRIEGATRTQVLASMTEANELLADMRKNIELTGNEWTQVFMDTNRADPGNSGGKLEELIRMFQNGGIDARFFKDQLEDLKAAYPNIPANLILSLQNYADTTLVAEENSNKLRAAWTLMGDNIPDVVRKAAEEVLGIQSIFDKLTNITPVSGTLSDEERSNRLERDKQTAEEILRASEEKLRIDQAAAKYGEDSLAVAMLRMDAENAATERQLAGLSISEELKDQVMAAVRAQNAFNNTAMSSSIQEAIGFARELVGLISSAIAAAARSVTSVSGAIAAIRNASSYVSENGGLIGAGKAALNTLSGGRLFASPLAVTESPRPPERPFELGVPDLPVDTGGTGGGAAQRNLEEADSLAKLKAEMQGEADMLRLSNSERAIQEDILSKIDRLRQAGITLSPLETAQLELGIRKLADLREQAELFGSAIDRVMQGAEDALVDFVKTGKVDFSDLVTSMIADIARLAAQQYIMKPLTNILNNVVGGLLGGAGGGFTLFGGGSTAPTYATGGGFTVGGSGGVDSQLVQLRASPGERVNVTRSGQSSEGGSNGVTNVFNITTPDVKGFKASETQIAARMARLANRGTRNS